MGSSSTKTTKLPLVPLARDTVLLPGLTLRIPLTNRPDLANLLSTLLNRNKRDLSSISIGCVPLASPRLSKDGRHLIDDGQTDSDIDDVVDAGQARKDDLFRYGTVAKIVGLQRRIHSEPYLLVTGVQRMTVVKVLRDRPYFEAEVQLHSEPGERNLFESPVFNMADINCYSSVSGIRLRDWRTLSALEAALKRASRPSTARCSSAYNVIESLPHRCT